MPGIDSRVPDADVPEQRRLLEILVVLCAVFGGVSVLVHMVVTDPGAALMGLVLLAAGLAFLAIRSLLDRLSLRTTVVATVATTLVAGLACAWAQPIYTVFTVVPLLAVGIALPYVRGTALRSIMVVAWLATMLTTYILETSTYMSSLAPEIRSFFLFGGLSGAVGAFLLQLWRFSSRLRGALDQAQAAEVLREESETRYGALVGRLAGVVYVSSFGSDSPIHYVSPQVESLFGYTQAEWVAGNGMWASRIHEDDRIRVLGEESGTLATADTHTWEYRLLTRDGRELWIRDDETVVSRAADGTPLMVQGFMLDITNQKRLEAELSHQAFHDALTGLPNRAAFAERVNGAISRSRRSGQALAVAYIDLDDFKVVNDTLGHAVGDRLLIEVADRLHASLRGGDAAARVGGDEFNVLLEGLADTIDAEDVVRRILDLLSQPYRLDDREVRIRATAGIAGLDDSVATAEDLQRHADAALYEAKADGKSRLAWFDPAMSARAWARLDLEHGLRRALEQGELEVAYQPVVDLATGALDGIEALARWRHPERGMVPPDEFIPVAERAGLIADLGRSVLGEACRASVRMGTALDREPLPMSVNVSSRQILDSDLVGDVRTALAQAGLPARCLTLELTESVMVLEGGRTDQIIAALRALGVRLAIDDFGTGYSSLSLARRFPIDELKIDRSFVSGLGRTDEDAAIVAAAIAFARALHLDVTAEGVETTDQAASLRALGCDRAQGYLFARPMTEAALLAILAGGGMAAPRTPPALLQAG